MKYFDMWTLKRQLLRIIWTRPTSVIAPTKQSIPMKMYQPIIWKPASVSSYLWNHHKEMEALFPSGRFLIHSQTYCWRCVILIWTDCLAAEKTLRIFTFLIIPSAAMIDVVQAILSSPFTIGFSWLPKWELPRTAVHPLPSALSFRVWTSDPEAVDASLFPSLYNVVIDCIWCHWCQVTTLVFAVFFSIRPCQCHSLWTPEVAMGSILLPAFFAGWHTVVVCASGPWVKFGDFLVWGVSSREQID